MHKTFFEINLYVQNILREMPIYNMARQKINGRKISRKLLNSILTQRVIFSTF